MDFFHAFKSIILAFHSYLINNSKTLVAVSKVGIIITPNQPTYNLFSVDVTQRQKRAQRLVEPRLSKVAVMIKNLKFPNVKNHCYFTM